MATGRTRLKESFDKRNRNNVTRGFDDIGTNQKSKEKEMLQAYQKLLDSAYGAPVQQIEQTNIEQPLFPDVKEDNGNK